MSDESNEGPQRHAGGRPTVYRPEYPEQAQKLCNLGAIDEEIADFFNVDRRTITRWKNDHPEFGEALKIGKAVADDRVEMSLLQMAVGYEHDEVKIFMPAGSNKPVYAPYRARVPANPAAAIFWLKNRRRDEWRDKQEVEHTGKLTVVIGAADADL